MSDNLCRYRAIRDALIQCYPGQPSGTVARHLATLAALISGIVASKSTQLPKIASHVPDGHKPESRVKRFARWIGNTHVTDEVYFVPYTDILLSHLALQTLVLVIDGRVVGRGGVALMLHVVSKGGALPLAWQVRQGAKGHFPEDLHIALVEQVQEMLPPGASVVLLGDGECDGIRLQHAVISNSRSGEDWGGQQHQPERPGIQRCATHNGARPIKAVISKPIIHGSCPWEASIRLRCPANKGSLWRLPQDSRSLTN